MPFRILSLDGGGVRGVIAATILAEIKKQINQPLNKYFDLIAGTSTGAVLGATIPGFLTKILMTSQKPYEAYV